MDARRACPIVLLAVAACGARTKLDTPDAGPDAGRDAGRPEECDAGFEAPTVIAGTPLGESCTEMGSAGFSIEEPGCPLVEVRPTFADITDGSGGQPARFEISPETGCFVVTWDDCPEACDCDLDIVHEVCVTASTTCNALIVNVTNTITEYEAGNHVEAGYTISNLGTATLMSGTETRTFVYACAP